MVIENLNKYSEEQIASLQEKENVIRLIISEQPNRCNLEHLRKYLRFRRTKYVEFYRDNILQVFERAVLAD